MNGTRLSALAALFLSVGCADVSEPTRPLVSAANAARKTGPGIGIVDLGTLGGRESHALGLNTPRSGQRLLVVGDAQTVAGKTNAAYWYYDGVSGAHSAAVGLVTPGDAQSTAYGANEFEQIAGWSYTTGAVGSPGSSRAVRWTTSGDATLLGTFGGTYGQATSINSLGEIAGEAATADGQLHPFLWSPDPAPAGTLTNLGFFSGIDLQAVDRNASGTIVGAVRAASTDPQTAFVWRSSVGFTLLPSLGPAPAGSGASYAAAVNDAGVIVGFVNTVVSGLVAVRWNPSSDGTYVVQDLGLGDGSQANDINNAGEIVGTHRGRRSSGGFYLLGSALKELPALSGSSRPFSINDNGDVVGFSNFRNGSFHAVVWTGVRTP